MDFIRQPEDRVLNILDHFTSASTFHRSTAKSRSFLQSYRVDQHQCIQRWQINNRSNQHLLAHSAVRLRARRIPTPKSPSPSPAAPTAYTVPVIVDVARSRMRDRPMLISKELPADLSRRGLGRSWRCVSAWDWAIINFSLDKNYLMCYVTF